MPHSSPESSNPYAARQEVFRLYDNLSAWMVSHCVLAWDDASHDMGTYGDSGIPLTSGAPPRRSFIVSPNALQTYAPEMVQEFHLDPESGLFLHQIPETYAVDAERDWIIDPDSEKSAFDHAEPQLNIVCDLRPSPQGQPSEHLILSGVENEYCQATRQRRIVLDSGESMGEKPRFSGNGAKIITRAEIAALGKLTDMLYLYGPDATRYTSAES